MPNYEITIGERYLPLFEFRPHNALYSGRGCGKSVAVATVLGVTGVTQKKKIICGRQYQSSIQESSKAEIEAAIYRIGANDQYKITKTNIVSNTGSSFSFIGLDINPASMKSMADCDIFWGEEANTIKKSVFMKIAPTFLRKPKSSLIYTWNPEFSDDAVDEFYRGPGCPPNSFVLRATQDDNPYFEQTELFAQYHQAKKFDPNFEHVWHGAYNEHSEARIFTKVQTGHRNTQGLTPLYGLDFGFSRDPNAFVRLYVNHAERWIYITDALYFNAALIDMAPIMDSVPGARDHVITADSSRPETIDFLNTQGFSVMGALKGAGSVKTGITFLQGYDIFLAPGLEDAETEFQRYSWMVDRNQRILNVPCDKWNHIIDACRYAVEDTLHQTNDDEDGGITRMRRIA